MGCRVVNVWPRRCQSDCKDCIRLHSATKGNERKEENGKKKDKTTRKSLNIDTAVGTILSSGPTEGDWHLNLKSQTSRSRTSLFGVCLCVCLSLSWCQGYSQSPAIFLFGTTKKKTMLPCQPIPSSSDSCSNNSFPDTSSMCEMLVLYMELHLGRQCCRNCPHRQVEQCELLLLISKKKKSKKSISLSACTLKKIKKS